MIYQELVSTEFAQKVKLIAERLRLNPDHLMAVMWSESRLNPAARCRSFTDLYLACFFPVAIGKPDHYVLQTQKLSAGKIARQNPIFDTDKNSEITAGEFREKMKSHFPKNILPYLF